MSPRRKSAALPSLTPALAVVEQVPLPYGLMAVVEVEGVAHNVVAAHGGPDGSGGWCPASAYCASCGEGIACQAQRWALEAARQASPARGV